MEIFTTKIFEKRYADLPKQIKLKVEKQEKIFKKNIFHPSFHTEKLAPKSKEIWSLRIDSKYRITFRFLDDNKAVFLTIGSHDQVYKIKF